MQKESIMNQKNDFSGKYTKTGLAGNVLIKNFYSRMQKIVSPLEIRSVLEVACGPGFSTEYLSQIFAGKDFEASEFDPELVEQAKTRNPNIKIITESIYNLNRNDNSFNLVAALEVLEHLQEPEKAMHELVRVTNRYALISVPNEPLWRILNFMRGSYWQDSGNTPGHINHWSKNQFISFAEKFFIIKSVASPLPWTIILGEKKHD